MKKLVIVFVAVIIATLSMTACGNNSEDDIRELAKYELTWDQAIDAGYTGNELASYMQDYVVDNDIHVNEAFIDSAKEGVNTNYYLLNDNGDLVKLCKAQNSDTIYYVDCGGIY